MVNNEDIAWAAGFFEGEGHVKAVIRGDKSYLSLDVAQVYREPLDKLQRIFGGKVYGPYGPYASNRQAYFLWIAYGSFAIQALDKMLPYLYRKGEQAKEALTKWEHYQNEK